LQKQGFCKKNTIPQIFSPKEANMGMEILFTKPQASRNAMKAQILLLQKPVKKFATDQEE
jgi:hypothetical protein